MKPKGPFSELEDLEGVDYITVYPETPKVFQKINPEEVKTLILDETSVKNSLIWHGGWGMPLKKSLEKEVVEWFKVRGLDFDKWKVFVEDDFLKVIRLN